MMVRCRRADRNPKVIRPVFWASGGRSEAVSRLRVGVVGCGLVAQVMHLPYLRELHERFEVTSLCDLSPEALRFAGEEFFPEARRFERWEDLLAAPADAVMILTPGSHAPVAVAAATAGRHVFAEKPMCFSVAEAREMMAAAERTGATLMVGYMKRYDPAYERMTERVAAMDGLRLVRVTTLEGPIAPYVAHYPLHRGGQLEPSLIAELEADDRTRVRRAIGAAADDPALYRAYRAVLLDSLVHELNALRGLLGEPSVVRFARVAAEATNLTIVLGFGELECVMTWTDLPGLAHFEQDLAFYAPDERTSIIFPSPFLRSMPTTILTERGEPGTPRLRQTLEVESYEEAFKRELVEFHEAIIGAREPRTGGLDGARDVALCEAVVRSAIEGRAVASPTAVD